MIELSEAEKIIFNSVKTLDTEYVSLNDSLFRVLAQDILSKINMPPFDKAAMDGFAINSKDNSEKFKIVETIVAGKPPLKKINKGECSRIMTGAMLPEGADRVIKVEITQVINDYMYIKGEESNFNVCILGEDVKEGDIILKKGKLIRPSEVGIIASLGYDKIKVYKRPILSLITTGDEIVEPGNQLNKGQIYNSNAYSLSSQIKSLFFNVIYNGIVKDKADDIEKSIVKSLENSDVLLISGGVSMGDFDHVPNVIKGLGFEIGFHRVAIKPGRPTLFAFKDNKYIFGLPGNPVSTFVVFERLVKPFLFKLMGNEYKPVLLKGYLKNSYKRKKISRTFYVPAIIDNNNEVDLLEYHGSAHIHSLGKANCLLEIPKGIAEINKGDIVYVRQI